MKQSVQNYFNQNLVIGSILENGFEATLSSEVNVLSVWWGHFSVFCKFLSDKVESVFWQSKKKHSKLFKSKLDHRKLFRKWFWSYLELNNECSDHLKKTFFRFLRIWVTKLKPSSGKVGQSIQNYLNQNLVEESFSRYGFGATLISKTNILNLWKRYF